MKKLFLFVIAISIGAYAFALTSITTKNVTGGPFCGGAVITVKYTIDAPAGAGNVFTAQLSSKSGSFATPTNIGSVTSISPQNIVATIPLGTASGTNYKIRVIASNPSVIGTPCPNKLKINPKPTAPAISNITACEATLEWAGTPTAASYKVQYKLTSSGTWSGALDVGLATSYTFTNLVSSSSYDFQVRANCANGQKSDWAKVTSSTSVCLTPSNPIVTSKTTTTSSLNWNDQVCATGYAFRYKVFGGPTWTDITTVTSNIDLTGLSPATLYEAQVANDCGANISGYTGSAVWETDYFRLSGNEELASSVLVFPNPSNGEFTVRFGSTLGDSNIDISVQNMYGQIVYTVSKQITSGSNEEKITLSDAVPGLYFVTIKSGDKEYKQSLFME